MFKEESAGGYSIELDEQQKLVRDTAREFAEAEIRPHVMEWDEAQHFPRDLFAGMGELGFLGIMIPEEYGGTGLGYIEYALIVEEISRVCPAIGLGVAAHNGLCTNHIHLFGSEETKRKYLPDLASGRKLGMWGLTEPGSGSDAGGMRTTAVLDGDHWVLNGSKTFITHATVGQTAVVIAVTDPAIGGRSSSAFVLEKGIAGFTVGKKENKLGMRASDTATLLLENVRVPGENLLGASAGEGFRQALKILDGGRVSIAACALGCAQGAYEAALKYSRERKQFGKPLSEFQATQFKLARMATGIEAARMMTHKAAWMKMQGRDINLAGAQAKLYASEVATYVANEAVQILGGYGFTKDYPAEKYYRDVKLLTIGEGTSEIQRLVISRRLLAD